MKFRSTTLALTLLAGSVVARADDSSSPAAPAANSSAPQEQAPAAPPEQDLTPYQTALTDYKNGKYVDARTAIEEADKEKPNDPTTIILKARILTELRDFADAKTSLEGLTSSSTPLPAEVEKGRLLALADLFLRKRDFDNATKYYQDLLTGNPNDPDLLLKIVYTRVGAGDLVTAAKFASSLKPLDPVHPNYYFAKAAISEGTSGSDQSNGEDIETARTIYGVTVTNRYLKTYLQVFSQKTPQTTSTPAAPGQTPGPVPTGAK